jgi:hypothetical protein
MSVLVAVAFASLEGLVSACVTAKHCDGTTTRLQRRRLMWALLVPQQRCECPATMHMRANTHVFVHVG